MKLLNNLGLLITTIIIISSCSTSTKSTEEESTIAEDVCVYKYDNSSLDFKWTAYKFTSKLGVPGTFNDITVTASEDATSVTDLLETVKFSIKTSSVNSNDPTRDVKIEHFLFGTMKDTDEITGSIKSVEDSTVVIRLVMNGFTMDLASNLEIVGDTIKIAATVDFKEFGAEEAVAMLAKMCSEKHTGEDGKAVFWDVVDINISALYTETCN